LSAGLALAGEGKQKQKSLKGVEFFTGFGWGKLHNKDNYNLYPLAVDFDFDLKPLAQKLKFNPKSLLQFQIEPFIAPVSSPNSNVEIGTSFFFKMGILPETSKFQPFIKAGVGLDYMTQHTREQADQFNFISTACIGMHYFLKKNVALTLEGRYRHLSNASVGHPNHGVNTAFVLAGVSYQF
jgi:hypothetical protein